MLRECAYVTASLKLHCSSLYTNGNSTASAKKRHQHILADIHAVHTLLLHDTTCCTSRTAQSKGVRVVCLRTGVVLDPKGGALAKLLPIFRLGAGGNLGSGQQYFRYLNLPVRLSSLHCASIALFCRACCGSVQHCSVCAVSSLCFCW